MSKGFRKQPAKEKVVEPKVAVVTETVETETVVTETPVADLASVSTPEVKVTEQAPKAQPNVRVKPNQDINTYIGDSWYRLKKGVEANVPANVKEILSRAGALEVL